jgi:hypothetical protein
VVYGIKMEENGVGKGVKSNTQPSKLVTSLSCVHMGEGGWEETLKESERACECILGMNVSTNEFSNTSQLVMVPGSNE